MREEGMIYLNWTETHIPIEVVSPALDKVLLKMKLNDDQVHSLVQYLEEVYQDSRQELRLGLSPEWTLFWKQREEGCRALMAHPEKDEWVGTLALEVMAGKKLLSALINLKEEPSFQLSKSVTLASVSNLDILISK
jgi:hypothetical protein